MSFDAYVKEVQIILIQLPDMAEADKVEHFINGLKSQTKKWVNFLTPKTLHDAIYIVTNFERSHYGEQDSENPVKRKKFNNNNNNAKNMLYNNNRDYSNKPINNNNNNSSFNRPLIKCNYCNRNGHLEKDCFKKKKTQPPMTPNRKDERKDTKFNQIYYQRERKVKDDSKLNDKRITINSVIKEKKSEELFVVIGKINNKEAKILIDTVSNKNFISRKMVKKIGVKPRRRMTR